MVPERAQGAVSSARKPAAKRHPNMRPWLILARLDIPLGRSFEYVFDLGAGWEHACTVLRDQVDPREEAGILPTEILPVFGWGAIPDQYGRAAPDSDDSSV